MSGSVLRSPGMSLLVLMTFLGFSGFAALLPVAPLWAVHGGAGSVGAGLVNGVLMLVTVLTQLAVPASLRRFGWAPVLTAGMLMLGLPAAAFALSD
ncbi:MAG TPA: MFS transporter, partial [Brevibacterium sp.]|nr:MFS transporter [Brevibacterium sp.]